ncbi:MAG: cobyrinate a,c-diamide synthase [Actinomycetota bacterium]|nr:cobyrinate a,c-diamide synthase [Actinomycetota bacterium]
MTTLGPRLVVSGTRSGAGKTTVASGLMAAFRHRGWRVASAKVGPDFIDPGYHSIATGRPARNLDPWMCGVELLGPLASRAGEGADVLVVEGVMGLFDGAADGTPSSTAEVAKRLDAPVVLVVDAASTSQSVAAVVHGFRTFDPAVHVAGVVLNLVGSDSHEAMLRAALADSGVPVYGALRRDDALRWRSRHLGLQPVAEDPAGVGRSLDRLAVAISARCDLDGLMRLARAAPPLPTAPLPRPRRVVGNRSAPRVAVASGPAFSFCYPDNLEALGAAGAEVVTFDPCVDAGLPPETSAVLAGGGFPELYAEVLAANEPMLRSVADHHLRGGVIWAECGGLLWLTRTLDGSAMAGVVDADATMSGGRVLGYRSATTTRPSPLGPPGTQVRGHEFHYSATDPGGDALVLAGRHGTTTGGFAGPHLLASYLHVHLASYPTIAETFVSTAARSPLAAPGPAGHGVR